VQVFAAFTVAIGVLTAFCALVGTSRRWRDTAWIVAPAAALGFGWSALDPLEFKLRHSPLGSGVWTGSLAAVLGLCTAVLATRRVRPFAARDARLAARAGDGRSRTIVEGKPRASLLIAVAAFVLIGIAIFLPIYHTHYGAGMLSLWKASRAYRWESLVFAVTGTGFALLGLWRRYGWVYWGLVLLAAAELSDFVPADFLQELVKPGSASTPAPGYWVGAAASITALGASVHAWLSRRMEVS
jgi:hypothetical protein